MRSTPSRTFTEDARRRQIVDCAIELIADVGYPQASQAKIAERAGIAKSVVLYHFANKDDLVTEIVNTVFTKAAAIMVPAIAAAPNATEKLTAYIDANGQFLATHRREAVALFEISNSYRSSDGLRLDQQAQKTVEAQGIPPEFALLDPQAIVELGISTGEFRADLDPAMVRNAIRGSLDGAVSDMFRNPDYDIHAFTETLKVLYLNAIGAPR
ncbi:TetR family transcriptional regulator [Gordonia sp. TBRC 11910]|uniref:TetR family transcriptional regulator n=1 Tax=Gordonia asplenii TaxID=2725283 RepID=A0A848L3C4_9ACTN|nr:TetR/AcrR family transcriptional regulator [Gordonia asplenii]NMO02148.1 TetR family transcriptional regulator [Gordonia asplenii]